MLQPVAMLGEVVPEATLHAGGAEVRRALLDPGRRDPHQLVAAGVEVDLAPDTAIRTDRPDRPVRRRDDLGREPLRAA